MTVIDNDRPVIDYSQCLGTRRLMTVMNNDRPVIDHGERNEDEFIED